MINLFQKKISIVKVGLVLLVAGGIYTTSYIFVTNAYAASDPCVMVNGGSVGPVLQQINKYYNQGYRVKAFSSYYHPRMEGVLQTIMCKK